MSKGLSIFVRIFGCLVAGLQIFVTLTTRERYNSNIWDTLVPLGSAALWLALTFSYAKVIDTILENMVDIRWMKDNSDNLGMQVSDLHRELILQGGQVSALEKQVSELRRELILQGGQVSALEKQGSGKDA